MTNDNRLQTKVGFEYCVCYGVAVGLPVYCTIYYQNNDTVAVQKIVLCTMASYGCLYSIMKYFPNCLQPSNDSYIITRPTKSSDALETQTSAQAQIAARAVLASEWRSRILSTINATLLIIGSVLSYNDWKAYQPESKGWVLTTTAREEGGGEEEEEEGDSNFLPSSSSWYGNYSVLFSSLFLGYLQWDICWLLYHYRKINNTVDKNTISAVIHHGLFIAISHYLLYATYFRKPFAWLSFTELSTPFLNIRWLLSVTKGRTVTTTKVNNTNNSTTTTKSLEYYIVSILFGITFVITRVVGYGWGLYDVWYTGYQYWSPVSGLKYGVVVGLHLGYILNLLWSTKVITILMRSIQHVLQVVAVPVSVPARAEAEARVAGKKTKTT